ncbi:MAG: VOC family protein [Verrucomicrobiales bacterium]|nr:VOC family protein [Verrucomicrobiales bacterium]
MNLSLEHIGLASKDPVQLCSWYEHSLGATVVYTNGQNPPAYLIALPGGALIEIYPGSHSVPETGYNRLGGWRHLALRVESIEAAQAHLAERGVVFSEPIKPAGGGGRVLFFPDADGNLLHLVERPANWVPTP